MRRIIFVLAAGLAIVVSVSTHFVISQLSPAVVSAQAPAITTTLPLKPDSVRFAVVGDNGTADSSEYQVGEQMQKMEQLSKFNFVIMLGDNLYGGSSASDYAARFERPYKALLDEGVRFYASLGNHDDVNEISYAGFHMEGQHYYTHTEGAVEFFVLDSNYMDGVQLDWLQQELQKSTATWKIAFFHHPLYSSGKTHGSSRDLRTVLEPLFEKYGVNVVLSGHDHIYERVYPQNGILYFVVGNSGKLRNGDLRNDSMKAAGLDNDRSFMVVEITGDEFYFQTVSRTGQTVDSGVFKRQAASFAENVTK